MKGITGKISRAVLGVLCECSPRSLDAKTLTVYAAGRSGAMMTIEITLRHLADLEQKGLVMRETDPLDDDELRWMITANGKAFVEA